MGFKLQYDFSIIPYAAENGLILIIEENEKYCGRMKNQIPCVNLSQNPSNNETLGFKRFEILPE